MLLEGRRREYNGSWICLIGMCVWGYMHACVMSRSVRALNCMGVFRIFGGGK